MSGPVHMHAPRTCIVGSAQCVMMVACWRSLQLLTCCKGTLLCHPVLLWRMWFCHTGRT
jgi:hypothetical protein